MTGQNGLLLRQAHSQLPAGIVIINVFQRSSGLLTRLGIGALSLAIIVAAHDLLRAQSTAKQNSITLIRVPGAWEPDEKDRFKALAAMAYTQGIFASRSEWHSTHFSRPVPISEFSTLMFCRLLSDCRHLFFD
jgi:hypothetical protein